MARIALIACSSRKLNHEARAIDLYQSLLFRRSVDFAGAQHVDRIFILSAKHGLLRYDERIAPYDTSLNTMKTASVKAWAKTVLAQLERQVDLEHDHFIVLAGSRYRRFLLPALRSYQVPLKGLGIGEQLQFLKRATSGDKHQSALRRMGSPEALPRPTSSSLEWVKAVEEGLPIEALESAVEQGMLSWNEVQTYIIPRRTFPHQKARAEPLTPEESGRLLRLLRIMAKANETFQNGEKARRWLRKPNRALGGEVPLEMLQKESGARLVEQVLGRIAYGVYS